MNSEEQTDELFALESILEPCCFKVDNCSGEIKVEPILKHAPLKIVPVRNCYNEKKLNNSILKVYEVIYLPPISLHFTFPSTYPSESPPEFVLSCAWLSKKQLILLCNRLDEIWKDQVGNVVLFIWHQFLLDESLEYLGITDTFEIQCDFKENFISHKKDCTLSIPSSSSSVKIQNKAVQDIRNEAEILPYMLTYNQNKKEEIFKLSTFDCQICYETKVGSDCIQFTGCEHVHCKNCISSYFSIHIKDGDVKTITCPAEKCSAQPLPKQVQELTKPSEYKRYETLLLQTTLDTMDDVIYCPLTHCQSPVIVESESSIALCPSCSYAFCPFCRFAYHGVSNCKAKSSEILQLCEEYKNATNEDKQRLEKRYGKKVLVNAIEESQSEAWMENNTKSCPSCHAKIEKIDGCNKITCYKCRAYFCWLCESTLDKSNPYRHFNMPQSQCFNQLFQGVVLDDEFDLWL